jgi:hypothetical protein
MSAHKRWLVLTTSNKPGNAFAHVPLAICQLYGDFILRFNPEGQVRIHWFIGLGIGKTPNSIRTVRGLLWSHYEYFSCRLSGAGWMQIGPRSNRLSGCGDRRAAVQTQRAVDFGGSSFSGRLPGRYGIDVIVVDWRRARKRNDLLGMAPVYSLVDYDPRSLRLVCPGFQPQAGSEAGVMTGECPIDRPKP